jgi:RNA polymerase sigma-70 factor (ECF subfamily)
MPSHTFNIMKEDTMLNTNTAIKSLSKTEFNSYFENIYNEHIDQLYRFTFFRVSDKEKAIDIVQDVFFKYFRYLEDSKQRDDEIDFSHKAYLFKTIRNTIIDHYRKKQTQSLDELLDNGFEYSSDEDVSHATSLDIDYKAVLRSIKGLDIDSQELISMRFIEGLSLTDIAEITGQKENTIAVKVHRILEKLKQRYDKNY